MPSKEKCEWDSDEERYWVDENPCPETNKLPFGDASIALVDEKAGGIIAWFGGPDNPSHMAYTVLEMLQDV
tara:strand:- start:13429 stop:13641 length:213 start_codon:yes stop_codon:yes gene_type:complete